MSRLDGFVVSIWLGFGRGAMAFVGCIETNEETAPDDNLSPLQSASGCCPNRSGAQTSGGQSNFPARNSAQPRESYDNRSRFFPDLDPEDDSDCVFGR